MATRRDVLTSIPAIGTALVLGGTLSGQRAAGAQEAEAPEVLWIEGYASRISINQGEPVGLHVSTNARVFDIVVYRLGHYAGAGARVCHVESDLAGVRHDVPSHDPETGLLELDWPAAFTLETSSEWKSGVYIAKLVPEDQEDRAGHILFIVRSDGKAADVLFPVATATYQAYNNWGGKSLYDFNSEGGRAAKVSYSRPFSQGNGVGRLFQGDFQMIQWLEREGYDVTYAASEDLHQQPDLAGHYHTMLSNFHDEYYSWEMRFNLEKALAGGTNLAFFSANNIYWQTRYERSRISGDPVRTLVCYKDAARDPAARGDLPERTTVRWRDAPVARPENALLGTKYEGNFDYDLSFPWIVTNARHWIYEGTDLRDGDAIEQMIGHEYDRVFSNGLTPPGLTMLSASPIEATQGEQNCSIYEALSGAMVFNAATNRWPVKLERSRDSHPAYAVDMRVRTMTRNILNRMVGRPPTEPEYESYVLYSDALAFDWKNNKSPVDLSSRAASASGTHGLELRVGEEGGRLSLNSLRPVITDAHDSVTIAIKAANLARVSLQLWNDGSEETSPPVALRDYIVQPGASDGWANCVVPLRDLNAENARISWFWIRCSTGPQSIYIDQIAFTRSGQ